MGKEGPPESGEGGELQDGLVAGHEHASLRRRRNL